MLLMQLDSQAMDNLLMGPEGQASITQCIINTMSDCNQGKIQSQKVFLFVCIVYKIKPFTTLL